MASAEKRVTYVAAKFPYWGRGDTKAEALRAYRKAGGRSNGKPKVGKVTWTPDPGETGGPWVNDFGSIVIPGEPHGPVEEV